MLAPALALAPITTALSALYGVGKEINAFIDDHIEQLKRSENPTINRTGRVLEMAKFGFGLGFITPVAVIAAGQLLLGNTLAAISTVATAATLSNPIAMTCAAIGAIYYGWNALSNDERDEILQKLATGLEIGIELVKSVIRFVLDTTKEIFSSKNIDEFKRFIADAAAVFGKSLGDVTHKVTDLVGDAFSTAARKSEEVLVKTKDIASDTYRSISETAGRTADGVATTLERTAQKIRRQEAVQVETTEKK